MKYCYWFQIFNKIMKDYCDERQIFGQLALVIYDDF